MAVVCLLLGALAVAPDAAPPARLGDRVYVEAGSTWDWAVASAPLPADQLGAIAVAELDRAAGRPAADIALHGALPAGLPPEGWPRQVGGALARRGPAPLGAGDARGACACATRIGDRSRERIGALWAARRFTVGAELSELGLLVIDVRYRDGLVLWINGREVARRNLPRGAAPMTPATRLHGPEWETFLVPVTPGLLAAGDNVIAIELRPSARELAPELDLRLAGRSGSGRVVRGPLVQRVDGGSAIIVFETDVPVAAMVEYGPTAERGLVARSSGGGLAVHHVVELTGLPPGKAVHYRVIAGADVGPPLEFATAPARGQPVRFAVYGDVRGGHTVHARVAAAVLAESPDFVLTTGDLVLRGSDLGDWQRFFAVAGDLLARIPVYPAAGNHDIGLAGDEERRFGDMFALWPLPPERPAWAHWYSFDVADVHVVMLDSNAYDQPAQLDWLARDLTSARKAGARWIFAVTHDGPYSRGTHGGNRLAAEEYAPILARHKVAVLFSGHDHIYQRGEVRGLRYVVSGGGGAPLYSIACGVSGRRACRSEDGMQKAASEHHYVMVTVHKDHALMCPRRPDRSPLEPCIRL